MKKYSIFFLLLFSVILSTPENALAQDDLLGMMKSDSNTVNYTTATFKSTRIINGHSVETVAKNHMDFRISHRFGTLNSGAYNLWGLDMAYIRLGFEYGITDQWMVGVGRSNTDKTYDLFTKVKLLRQSSGTRNMPFTMTFFVSSAVNTLRYTQEDRSFVSRFAYTTQLIIARKFSENLSLQLSPTLLHRNRVENIGEKNTVWALGLGGRYKLSKRVSFNADYYYVLPDQLDPQFHNSLALGFDIETGGHVFSVHFTNSLGMIEKQFIGETTGQWGKGDIHYGFNVSRTFSFNKNARRSTK
ncbi:DUF5777 family beta-barrel protein [Cytophagaceae bacterium DM2B3-1]|uniref:DUF5777 family beta-barrel protein n=1 Tax=Xanthocytophaga flava TaxID=3048013 RepID=A0ABT7CIM3_9BACT|nr:DUF5777 family beta-barrel protein [Xanthocytophaga flavus]MDJ1493575.1 DUF5777 family beta-barrel protein [Xanthocytophaga flavus]